MSRYLPQFPLGTPVMPTQLLPMHVFEPRYRVLMETLTSFGATAEMGVVMIERGSEVGGGDERASIGTVAHLIESHQLPDGRWAAIFAGSHRFRVERWLDDDPYPQAIVEEFADGDWDPADDELLGRVDMVVRQALDLAAKLGDPAGRPGYVPAKEPARASWEMCDRAPLGPLDRQRLLAVPTFRERLELLAELVDDVSSVLAFRLQGR